MKFLPQAARLAVAAVFAAAVVVAGVGATHVQSHDGSSADAGRIMKKDTGW